jgi:hypothetical protein
VPLRRFMVLCMLLGVFIFGWIKWRQPSSSQHAGGTPPPIISKQPVAFATRTFDPAAAPADMPPLSPGEEAECVSNFLSEANVGGQSRRIDATHAIVTITQIKIALRLDITIWVPDDVTARVIDHEQGHRQISEYYYRIADKVAERIAAPYMGRRVEVTGSDLSAEIGKTLEQMGAEITDEYNKELDPDPTQLRYDAITDHSRSAVVASDAVAQAIKEMAPESTRLAAIPGN